MGGEPRLAGADVIGVRVVDWRGALRVEARDGTGRTFVLDPNHPMLQIEGAGTPVGGLTWRAFGPDGQPLLAGPLVELRHAGGAGCGRTAEANSALISWAHLDAWLARVAGLDLARLLGRQQPPEAAPFRLRFVDATDGEAPRPATLELDMPGIAPIFTLPLRALGDNRYAFVVDRPDLLLRGQILLLDEGVFEIRLTSGSIGRGPHALPLRSAQLRLGRSAAAPGNH